MFHLTETYTDSEDESENNVEEATNNNASITESYVNDLRPKFTKLVSYHDVDETVLSDEEMAEDELHKTESGNHSVVSPQKEDIILPPEPLGRCSTELQDKIARISEKMHTKGYDMNKVIQQRKEFRNPSIYEKLVEFCSINEFGTNYEPHMYDPLKWNKSSYYDELGRVQRQELEQKMKEIKQKRAKKTGIIVQHISNFVPK